MNDNDQVPPVKTKFYALRTFTYIFAGYAVLVVLACLLVAYFMYLNNFPLPIIFATLVGGSFMFLTILAIVEGIQVFLAIEENTRITAEYSLYEDVDEV